MNKETEKKDDIDQSKKEKELDDLMEQYSEWSKKTWEYFVEFCMTNLDKENMDMKFYEKMGLTPRKIFMEVQL